MHKIKEKLKIEVQFFQGCPNSVEMINNVHEALLQLGINVDYSETYVETPELAKKIRFRGSPTLIINGLDLEGLREPEEASLACRFYSNGIPSIEKIKEFILKEMK